MKEYNLQMAWKLSMLAGQNLTTVQGDIIEIIFPGYGPSQTGGPDFTFAKVKINDILFVGSIEIHIASSQWYEHHHESNSKYDNVILHVVWECDKEVTLSDKIPIPCLQLKDFFSDTWFQELESRFFSSTTIPCANLIRSVPEIVWQSQLEVAIVERVNRRVVEVERLYNELQWNWDEVLHRLMARFMGQKINNQPMEQIAISLPYKIVLKHSSVLKDVEALLLGQGGFLEDAGRDHYIKELIDRYTFMCHKYNLKRTYNIRMQWQYKGLRPISFPELRIAQWAYLIHKKGRYINWAVNTSIEELWNDNLAIGEYWKHHYRIDAVPTKVIPQSQQWYRSLLINALLPFRIAYHKRVMQTDMTHLEIDIYDSLPPEKNHIVNLFERIAWPAVSVRDTQAMLELYNNYCNYKKCLSCRIGQAILKREGWL